MHHTSPSSILVFVCGILVTLISEVDGQECTQTGVCSCKTDKGTIDLSAVASSGGTARFQDVPDSQQQYKFSYNPCVAFTQGSCTNVAACQVEMDDSVQYPIGAQDSALFGSDPTSGAPMIIYSSTDSSGTTRTTEVTLVCDTTGGADTLTVLGETGPGSAAYAMTLTSKHCCPSSEPAPGPSHGGNDSGGNISIGTIICIALGASLVLYIAVGIGVQKGVRKAEGKDVIPNYTFWSAIPGLVKDGVLFTFRGCKGGPATYDKV